MRLFFVFFLFLILFTIFVLIVMQGITGNIVNTAGCTSGQTYAFYRTPAERAGVEQMWQQAGFVVVSDEPAPSRFGEGYKGFLCLERGEHANKDRIQNLERSRVVTQGSSKYLPATV